MAEEMPAGIAEFIAARLDQWEQIGRQAYPHQTGSRDEGQPPEHVSWRRGPGSVEFGLRHLDVLRLIVKLHDRVHDCPVIIPVDNSEAFAEGMYVSTEHIEDGEACTTLRLLAADWITHPDYRADWKP
jgi:hypothetical protein